MHGTLLPEQWLSGDYGNPFHDSKLSNSGAMPSEQSCVRTLPTAVNTCQLLFSLSRDDVEN